MFKIEKNRVVYEVDGLILAYVTYPFIEDKIVLINHTVVDPSLQGQGIASKLLELAYKDIKEKGFKAKLSCSYAIKWFSKYPEYGDVVVE